MPPINTLSKRASFGHCAVNSVSGNSKTGLKREQTALGDDYEPPRRIVQKSGIGRAGFSGVTDHLADSYGLL